MKNLMKMLFAAMIIAAFGVNAFAQKTGPSDDITARAEVRVLIDVNGVQDLEFKNVQVGEPKTVNSRDEVIAGTASGDERSGRFEITKGADTEVMVEFTTLPELLAGPNESNLPIDFDNASFGRLCLTVSNQGGVTFNPISPQNTPNEGSTEIFFSSTTFNVYLGGTVTPAANQEVGTYEENVTLTVSYN